MLYTSINIRMYVHKCMYVKIFFTYIHFSLADTMQVSKDHTFGTMVQPDEYGTYVQANVCVQCMYVHAITYVRIHMYAIVYH